jgi:hypothetical protein
MAGTLGVTARAVINVTPAPVRSLDIGLLFDRITYRPSTPPIGDNALDRIEAYYKPTVNMPDTHPQLMTGLTYPNVVTQGARFDLGTGWDLYNWSEMPWDVGGSIEPLLDTIVESPSFLGGVDPIRISLDTMSGGRFEDGYGPEELVPGNVTDTLTMNIEADVGLATDPSYRLHLDRNNRMRIYNANPHTRTTLARDWLGEDEIKLTDLTKIVEVVTITAQSTDASLVNLYGIDTARVTGIKVTLLDDTLLNHDWISGELDVRTSPGEMNLRITDNNGDSILPQGVRVTLYIGNTLYVNGEYICFGSVDPDSNTVSDLRRGALHTITNQVSVDSPIYADTVVQSVLPIDQLSSEFYNRWWFGSYITGFESELDPPLDDKKFDAKGFEPSSYDNLSLAQSLHPAAVFLQSDSR